MELADVTFLGVLLIVVSIPLTLGWIPRNNWYGFRVPSTMRRDAVWYAINRRFGREAIVIGLVMAVLGISLHALGVATPDRRAVAIIVLAAAVLWVVRVWRAANQLERAR